MYGKFQQHLQQQLDEIQAEGLYKAERVITSPQGSHVTLNRGEMLLNLCANNYLGLAQHPAVREAAETGMDHWGYGLASVRFICGTQSIHKELEQQLSTFLQMEETILYPSCFDANGGLFETLLGPEDAVISDELNHASIIDGIRLCRAQRYRYKHNDMEALEAQLKSADSNGARFKLISTDGVFSMDGTIAQLDKICDLADRYQALVHFDDSHAVGFVGQQGRGTHEYCHCMDRVDLTTGTLGKALGGASGGYTSGRREMIQLLRQRSRPYLFSNTVAPAVVTGSLKSIELLSQSTTLRDQLEENTAFFRAAMVGLGFDILPGTHPIVPIMLYDAPKAVEFAERMLDQGVYVIAFSFPVVAKGKARIRTQLSAAHSREDLEFALQAFARVKTEMNL